MGSDNPLEKLPSKEMLKRKSWNICCICKATTIIAPDRRFFRFPKNPERSQKWKDAIRNLKLSAMSPDILYDKYRVCSSHFEPSSFATKQCHYLKKTAVPQRPKQLLKMAEVLRDRLNSSQASLSTASFDNSRIADSADSTSLDVASLEYRTGINQDTILKKKETSLMDQVASSSSDISSKMADQVTVTKDARSGMEKDSSIYILQDNSVGLSTAFLRDKKEPFNTVSCDHLPLHVAPESLVIRIKQEPGVSSDFVSVNVETDQNTLSHGLPTISYAESLFQPPVLIKEEIVSEDEQ